MLLLLGALNYYKQDPTFPYANLNFALGSISIQMNYLIVIAVAFTGLIYDNEDKQHTIKHAVAFGIKRSTIYLSRFLTTVLISSLIYLILVTGYTVVARLLLPPLTGDEIRQLIIVSIGSMTCLYAAIAVAQCFLMVMENQTLAYIYSLLIIVALPILLTNAGRKITFLGELAKGFIYHAISPAGPMVVAGEGQLGGVLFCLDRKSVV